MPRGGCKWKVSVEMQGVLPNVRKHIKSVIGMATETARQEWIRLARERLRSSKKEYILGIGPAEVRGLVGTIRLNGWLPNAIEEGKPPFDMKPGLLSGPNVKRTKKGQPYNTVPFSIKTPGSQSFGAMEMPKSIYSLAKNLDVGESLKLPKRLEGYAVRTRLSPEISKWGHYTWKTSPYEGVTKTWKFPGQGSGPKAYKSFRRVSRKSNPNSWIHPGFRAKNLMEEAANNLEHKFAEILNGVL